MPIKNDKEWKKPKQISWPKVWKQKVQKQKTKKAGNHRHRPKIINIWKNTRLTSI